MRFQYAPFITETFPHRVTGFLYIEEIRAEVDVSPAVVRLHDRARARLATDTEGTFPEIQA